jgi:hypothetical protein
MQSCPCAPTEHHAMKVYWGSGDVAPRILDLGNRWRWVVSFTCQPLYPQGKSPCYSLDRRLGGPQSRSGRDDEEKIPSPYRDSKQTLWNSECQLSPLNTSHYLKVAKPLAVFHCTFSYLYWRPECDKPWTGAWQSYLSGMCLHSLDRYR